MVFPIIGGSLASINALTAQLATSTSAIESSWIDMSGYEGNALIILNSAAASASDTLDVTVLENTTDSGAGSAVPVDALFNVDTGANATFTQVTASASSYQTVALNLERTSRYIRVTATPGGGTISFPFSVQIVAPKKYTG